MPSLPLQGIQDQVIRRAVDSLNMFAEKLAYHPYHPVDLVPFNGAVLERVTIGGTARDISGYRLPAGAALPGFIGSIVVPPDFVTGKVALELELCGTAGGANNFALSATIDPLPDGDVPAQLVLGTWTVAGQGVAGAKFRTQTSLVDVPGGSTICGIKFLRATPDANAGDLYVLGIRPIWYPGRQ